MTIELADLPTRLDDLRARLRGGGSVTLTEGGRAVARVSPEPAAATPDPADPLGRLGFAKGTFTWVAPDFDAPMDDADWLGDKS